MKRSFAALLLVVCLLDQGPALLDLAAQTPARYPTPPASARFAREIEEARAFVSELVKAKTSVGESAPLHKAAASCITLERSKAGAPC